VSVHRDLLGWYDRERRDLPWRRDSSAYRTLVSEIMLQQTVVATVVPYFERFVRRFPDFSALADAPEEDVLAAWSGLGYYARGRNLHRAARAVVEGGLPGTEEELRRLPGVGAYTAAAIAAIVHGARTFALDGNAARVMARLTAEDRSIDEPAVRAALRSRGLALVPPDRPGDFAQAVMELGATVCVASTPRCGECPVARHCAAFASGKVASIPARTPKPAKRQVKVACFAVERRGRLLLVHRPPGTLLGGTWTLPESSDEDDDTCRRTLGELGLSPDGPPIAAGTIRHIFTHRDVTARVLRVTAHGRLVRGAGRWVSRDEVAALAVASFTRKALAVLDGGP
jgi:A/G-specific adenine glycosylase